MICQKDKSLLVAGTFDHLDEVDIVFPVPGQAEVIVHGSIIRDDETVIG